MRALRRLGLLAGVLLSGIAATAACSIDVRGTAAGGGVDLPEAGADAPVDPDAGSRPSLLPSNVPATTLDPNAASLTGVVRIDTTLPGLDLGGGLDASLPPGITFTIVDHPSPSVADGGVAALSVGDLTIDRDVAITGARPLVVVSSGKVAVRAIVSANGRAAMPGPGGFAFDVAAGGPGAGGRGDNGNVNDDSGGGGGGHGTRGVQGADVSGKTGGAGGGTYELPLVGGSAGGRGWNTQCGNGGGGGGGALQVFALTSLTVAASGGVNVGGGGGRGGCSNGTSAGGGGSGGYLLLESPRVEIAGKLAANGGGGGGGGYFSGAGGSEDGADGENGQLANVPAKGGRGGGYTSHNGGDGSTGNEPRKPGPATLNGGGGGGGAGRILLRSRGDASTTGASISPPAKADTSL